MNNISNDDIAISIISWTGQHEKAINIEESLLGDFPHLDVIYSDEDNFAARNDRWKLVPNFWFFSKKFETIIRDFKSRILLTITADAQFGDWPTLVQNCKLAFSEYPNLGIWSPKIDYSNWAIHGFSLGRLENPRFHRVFQTDSIVWALSSHVVDRMREFDYSNSIYGWGIDTAACMFCHANERLVMVDESLSVAHPFGTAYDKQVADSERHSILSQLTPGETAVKENLLLELAAMRKSQAVKPSDLRRNDPCFCGSGKRYKHCHGSLAEQKG